MKQAHVVDRELSLFDESSLSQCQSVQAALVLDAVRRKAQVDHDVGIDPDGETSLVSGWRTKLPLWVRDGDHHTTEAVLVSQDTMEQMKVWADEQVEFRRAHALPEDLAVDAMTEEGRYLANVDLARQIGLAQVRLKLSAGLYDSPLLYTVKGLDPWVDKQCTRLRRNLFKMSKVYDPNKVANAVYGFLWPFTQKGFKF